MCELQLNLFFFFALDFFFFAFAFDAFAFVIKCSYFFPTAL